MYELYNIINTFPILIVIAFFIAVFGVISLFSLLTPKRKGGGITGLYALLEELHIKKSIAIMVSLICSFILLFSDNTLVWLLDGQKDLRLAPEGSYCYYVTASREFSNKEYHLPAKVRKSEDQLYYVDNVYFSNGGYLYLEGNEYIEFDETFDCADQNEEFWDITLTNNKANHPKVQENYKHFDFNAALTLIVSIFLIIISFVLFMTHPENDNE